MKPVQPTISVKWIHAAVWILLLAVPGILLWDQSFFGLSVSFYLITTLYHIGLDGIQFVQSLQHPPMIIFVTAYKEHAFEGFELAAVDYLLKPVSFERYYESINRKKNYQVAAYCVKHSHSWVYLWAAGHHATAGDYS